MVYILVNSVYTILFKVLGLFFGVGGGDKKGKKSDIDLLQDFVSHNKMLLLLLYLVIKIDEGEFYENNKKLYKFTYLFINEIGNILLSTSGASYYKKYWKRESESIYRTLGYINDKDNDNFHVYGKFTHKDTGYYLKGDKKENNIKKYNFI